MDIVEMALGTIIAGGVAGSAGADPEVILGAMGAGAVGTWLLGDILDAKAPRQRGACLEEICYLQEIGEIRRHRWDEEGSLWLFVAEGVSPSGIQAVISRCEPARMEYDSRTGAVRVWW